ncbi:hypothetical protein BDW74DRAFT_84981 [Aspergillus multicolor]|uniref:uncharacterized protein n=1 Tax=Aspergillus multicolor TaxID=41759 RepID=UPI003CCD2F36
MEMENGEERKNLLASCLCLCMHGESRVIRRILVRELRMRFALAPCSLVHLGSYFYTYLWSCTGTFGMCILLRASVTSTRTEMYRYTYRYCIQVPAELPAGKSEPEVQDYRYRTATATATARAETA